MEELLERRYKRNVKVAKQKRIESRYRGQRGSKYSMKEDERRIS